MGQVSEGGMRDPKFEKKNLDKAMSRQDICNKAKSLTWFKRLR